MLTDPPYRKQFALFYLGFLITHDIMGARCVADFIVAMESVWRLFDVYALLFGIFDPSYIGVHSVH